MTEPEQGSSGKKPSLSRERLTDQGIEYIEDIHPITSGEGLDHVNLQHGAMTS